MTGTAASRSGDLVVRTVVGLGLILLAIVAIAQGGSVFALFAALCGLLMMSEWAGLHHLPRLATVVGLAIVAAPALLLSRYIALPEQRLLHPWLVIAGAGAVAALVARRPALLTGVLYAGLPTVALIWLRSQPFGIGWVLWTLAIVWATDIFAYFTGRTIGGRKLSPRISPNKTWSGLIGGVVAAGVVGWLVAGYFDLPGWCRMAGPALAVLAQIGDLFESALKRRAGVKDSGRLLPGHGGVMDRLDGVVPVAVAVAAAVAIQSALT